jgi:hypothetical protein
MMKVQNWKQWARVCAADPSSPSLLKKGSLAALTGQDTRALNAIVVCWELYANSDEDGLLAALEAVRALLPAMQPNTRWIARELIPFVLNWDDREGLWALVETPDRHSANAAVS